MAPSAQIIGLKEANRQLKQLPDDARVEVQQVMDVTAFQVASDATQRAPARASKARHGIHLKDAIRWKRRGFGAVVAVDARAFHWRFFEYGTVKMAARPMFRPAAETARGDHQRRLQTALQRTLTKMNPGPPLP